MRSIRLMIAIRKHPRLAVGGSRPMPCYRRLQDRQRMFGIWFGAVLRGDNEPISIGARSNIQEHAMLHTDPGFPSPSGRIAPSVTARSCMAAPSAMAH